MGQFLASQGVVYRPFKLTPEMLEAIEKMMKQDDDGTVTQLVKVMERG